MTAKAGAPNKALDMVFRNISPLNGVIEIRFTSVPVASGTNTARGDAFVQAIEVEPRSSEATVRARRVS